MDFLADEITLQYGSVQRARGCFLYTRSGCRLTDLYLDGGRAILGRGGGRSFTVFKNALNRGLTGHFDSDEHRRLEKAASALLNSARRVFAYYGLAEATKAAECICAENYRIWQAWNPDRPEWSGTPAVIIAPPLAWAEDIFLVCIKTERLPEASREMLPHSQSFPAPLYAAFTRAIYDMLAAVQERSEKDWFVYDRFIRPYWERKGPYLIPKIPEADYISFVKHCLLCKLVISPSYPVPSIVPFRAHPGVFSALAHKPFHGGAE